MGKKLIIFILIAIAAFFVLIYVFKFVLITALIIAAVIVIAPFLYFAYLAGKSQDWSSSNSKKELELSYFIVNYFVISLFHFL